MKHPHLLALPLVTFAASAAAHQGHGATPVHVHVLGVPLDLGIAAVAALVLGAAFVAVVKRRRS